MHKNGYLVYKKLEKDHHHENKNGHTHLNLSTEDLCPKTLLILAAGAEEEDVEQEDMAYTSCSFTIAGLVAHPLVPVLLGCCNQILSILLDK